MLGIGSRARFGVLELGLRVRGAPIKRHFDLSSVAKGPDGNQELPENVTLIFRVSRRARMDNR